MPGISQHADNSCRTCYMYCDSEDQINSEGKFQETSLNSLKIVP